MLTALNVQGPECSWFGEAVSCSHYVHLGTAAASITALLVFISSLVNPLGGQEMLLRSAGKWCDSLQHPA